MRQVVGIDEARQLIGTCALQMPWEEVSLDQALFRVLAEDVLSKEWIPDFDRSTVDGLAVIAKDCFGASESIPAMLTYKGSVAMGERPPCAIGPGECLYVPTGGQIPAGADAMVMIEYVEDYGDAYRYIQKPTAPKNHIIFRGDDVTPGQKVLAAGTRLLPVHMGVLAMLGQSRVKVAKRPTVAILSTGDELVPMEQTPQGAQMRDVNAHTLFGGVLQAGGIPLALGIVPDDPAALTKATQAALSQADVVLISGGSSIGARDITETVLKELGEIRFHGLAAKPGKPTMLATVAGKPVFGLPGHPVAAYLIFHLLIAPLLWAMQGAAPVDHTVTASLAAQLPSNHGREEYVSVALSLEEGQLLAKPVLGKSGLITTLSKAQGYVKIPRNQEGLHQHATVEVHLFQ